ncbi:uncharacterized protein METZ01_LOCUS172951, partial [marine metagenome]
VGQTQVQVQPHSVMQHVRRPQAVAETVILRTLDDQPFSIHAQMVGGNPRRQLAHGDAFSDFLRSSLNRPHRLRRSLAGDGVHPILTVHHPQPQPHLVVRHTGQPSIDDEPSRREGDSRREFGHHFEPGLLGSEQRPQRPMRVVAGLDTGDLVWCTHAGNETGPLVMRGDCRVAQVHHVVAD